ncbi:SH3 domain-containing protein [Peptostreptococcus canis]|uniref:SH3 domain-containing protein n=1 Tax=Peptostreptococcus canis TaxID=1159213 RepID=A0ABR6TLN4_9FIRM|nr:SH3 domain-containing protein [Peptostreptococcus canis]MBC2576220.1 SH3 domain-containing protein [Peptostreptococcus canis]MBP1998245.1 tetratricopeptide (TPR) repeat protein [Peptostreptococcus canis]
MRWKDRNINEHRMIDSKDLSQDTQEIKFNKETRRLLDDPELANDFLEKQSETSKENNSDSEYNDEFESYIKQNENHKKKRKNIFIIVSTFVIVSISIFSFVLVRHLSRISSLEREAEQYIEDRNYKAAADTYRKLFEQTGEQKYSQSYKYMSRNFENIELLKEAKNNIEIQDYEGAIEVLLTISSTDDKTIKEMNSMLDIASKEWIEEISTKQDIGEHEFALSEINKMVNVLPEYKPAIKLKERISLNKSADEKEKLSPSEEENLKKIASRKSKNLYDKSKSIVGTEQFITSIKANVRKEPSRESEIMDNLEKGDSVYIEETHIESDSRIWCKITYSSSKNKYTAGWISYNTLNGTIR